MSPAGLTLTSWEPEIAGGKCEVLCVPPRLPSDSLRAIGKLTGWAYYHISNATQYSNTALETTASVMYHPDKFSYMVPLFLMALRI